VGRCERRSSLLSLRVVFRECWAGLSVLLGKLQDDATVGTAARWVRQSKEREAVVVVVMLVGGSGNNGQRNAPVQKDGKSIGYGLLPLLCGGVLSPSAVSLSRLVLAAGQLKR
jgi:hypothetical protein